jgi:hypothetical protein
MNHPFKLKNAALLMALAAIYPVHAVAATGIAQFAVGDVNVRRGATTMPLNRGAVINSGDNVITGRAGQTQIRFSDGGLVSLAPNSQFNIDKYVDANKPEEDGFFASLLRGGMRAITGLVGKRNRENYKITTTTATIGIRGSAFSANYNPDGSLNVAGEQDGIVVCTNAGCVELIVGEAVRVSDSNSLPVRTAERSNVPPLVARQDLFESENPIVVQQIPLPEQTLLNGTLTGVSALFAFGDGFIDSYPRGGESPSDGEATFVDGQLVRHTGTPGGQIQYVALLTRSPETVEKTSTEPGTFGTVGTADDAGLADWGYWGSARINESLDGGGNESFNEQMVVGAEISSNEFDKGVHYVVGRPTPMTQMPMTGTASYTLIGGTAPTAYDGESLLVGTLASAGLNVDFSASRVNAFVNTVFTSGGQSIPVQISGYGETDGSTYQSTAYDGGYYGDGGTFYGFFIGDQAKHAGMVYEGYDDAIGSVQGSAVFLKTGAGLAFTEQAGMSAMFASADEYLFDYYPRGEINPSIGSGYFVGNQLYLHDDGEDSYNGYGYGGGSTYLSTSSAVTDYGSVGNAGDADFIGWGYWAKGRETGYNNNTSVNGVHYLVGRPTAANQMPSNGTATYSMVGGTTPTATANGTTIMGRLLGASMDVDFSNSSASATISTDFQQNGATVPVTIQETNMYIGGSWLCGNNIRGFFTGNEATRAGLIYKKDTESAVGTVSGAVGLQRGAITPTVDN